MFHKLLKILVVFPSDICFTSVLSFLFLDSSCIYIHCLICFSHSILMLRNFSFSFFFLFVFQFCYFLVDLFFFFFKFPGLFVFFVQFIIELLLYFRFFLGLKFPLDSSSEFLSLMKFSIVLPVMFILSTNFSKCL